MLHGDSSLRKFFCCTSLRMGLVRFILCVIIVSASGLLKHGNACGKYHISNSNDPSHESFYIDGKLVDRYYFCKALQDYHEKRCFDTYNVRNQYCPSLGIIKLQIYSYLIKNILYWYIIYSRILQRSCLCLQEENPWRLWLEKETTGVIMMENLWMKRVKMERWY